MTELEATAMLLMISGAFFMPILSNFIGLPAAVTELLYGVIIGASGFQLVESHEFLYFIAHFGFAYLMFLAGMEIDFPFLERQGISGLMQGGLVVFSINSLALLLVLILGFPLFYMLVFSALSIGILVVLLQELGLSKSAMGQDLLLVGSLGEFTTIILLTFFFIYIRKGFGPTLFLEAGKLFLVLLLAFLFLKILQLTVWWFPERFYRLVQQKDPSEMGVRAGFLLMMGFVAISALLHVEFILGAFVAGAVFGYVFRQRGALDVKLASAGNGFFIPIFFIHVGVNLELGSVFGQGTELFILFGLAGLLITKIPVSILALFKKRPLSEALAIPFLLATPLSLLVVIVTIGMDIEVMGKAEGNAVLFIALLSGLFYPVVGRIFLKK